MKNNIVQGSKYFLNVWSDSKMSTSAILIPFVITVFVFRKSFAVNTVNHRRTLF